MMQHAAIESTIGHRVRSLFPIAPSTSPRATLPLPFPREEWKKGFVIQSAHKAGTGQTASHPTLALFLPEARTAKPAGEQHQSGLFANLGHVTNVNSTLNSSLTSTAVPCQNRPCFGHPLWYIRAVPPESPDTLRARPEIEAVQEMRMMIQQPAIDITAIHPTLSLPKGKMEKGFICQVLFGL